MKRRIKVIKAIKALNYSPYGAAQALASKQSRAIVAMVPIIDNEIFAQGIQQLQNQLSKAHFSLLLSSSNYHINQ